MRLFAFELEDYPEGTLVRDERPLRLFHSHRLEALTHVTPATVASIFAPLVLGFLAAGAVRWKPGPLWQFGALFGFGVLLWTLIEYCIHRFVFHFPRRRWQA